MLTDDNNAESGFEFPRDSNEGTVVVRFKSDADIRVAANELSSAGGADVSRLRQILGDYRGVSIERTFAETPEQLDQQTRELTSKSGVTLPALNAFYHVRTENQHQAQAMAANLAQQPMVGEAYVEPPTFPAVFEVPSALDYEVSPAATPDFTAQQTYLDAATPGIDARYAWTHAGGRGQGIGVIDIEGAWNFNHEDLLLSQGGVVGGSPAGSLQWENHGTAVQGEISGDRNNFGITGIADSANFSAVSIFGSGNSPARALKTAADKLSKGDIILIELHRAGPNANGQGQFGFIAIEWWSADFAAVQYATAKGIIVIAAAGNGSQDLDDAVYQGKFDRNQRDSGALLVGAGAPPSGNQGPDRSRLGFSNYGAIVDAQGWGREVVTTGYGDLQGGSDKNRHYTRRFSGTSSASPIVVGAAACLQGIRNARGDEPLTNVELRNIFRTTGSAQTDGPSGPKTQRIGSRPDLRAAIAKLTKSQVKAGIATKYWLELVAYPPNSARSLWLLVDNRWKRLDSPRSDTAEAVQKAFLGGEATVRVWYDDATIEGLVIEGN